MMMNASILIKRLWITVWILSIHLDPINAANILLLPFPWKSHVFEISAIGQSLKDRGHDLSIILPPTFPNFEEVKGEFNVIPYHIVDRDVYGMDTGDIDSLLEGMIEITPIEDFRQHTDGFEQFCSNSLSDNKMFSELRGRKFDLAIMDAFPGSRCYYVIPYRLDIPYISLTTTYEPWIFRTPALPSIVPFPMAQFFTEKMSFLERLSNLYTLADWSYSTRVKYLTDDFIRPYIPDKPFVTLDDLARRSKLWLFDTDVLIDYPRPVMPNEINIGGLSTKPAKPLPKDLEDFVNWEQGFIVVSFGSFDILQGQKLLEKFLLAFRKVPQRVVLRSSIEGEKYSVDVPSTVKVLKWIPQNDLLGHPNCRLFITHCGANGQFEALYHGVPMLGFPIFADQPYNARRVTSHGFGLHMDLRDFTAESLATNIKKIINNETFYQNIEEASIVFRSREMTPPERAAFWVEQVLSPGGVDYLIPSHALEMPWYEYLMLDIILLVFCIPLAIVMAILCGIVCYCCNRPKESKKKNKSD